MLSFLRSMIIFARFKAYLPHPKWDEGERLTLQAFLETPAGMRFLDYMKAESFEQDRQATLIPSNPAYAAGFASGFRAAVAAIQNLS